MTSAELTANKHRCTACGCGMMVYAFTPSAHNPEHQVTKVGAEVECAHCDRKVTALKELAELVAKNALHHTRWRNGSIYCYRREPTSPSGVLLACSVEDCPEANALLTGSLSPLSPTEGL